MSDESSQLWQDLVRAEKPAASAKLSCREIYLDGYTGDDGRRWVKYDGLQRAIDQLTDEAYNSGHRIGWCEGYERAQKDTEGRPWFYATVALVIILGGLVAWHFFGG